MNKAATAPNNDALSASLKRYIDTKAVAGQMMKPSKLIKQRLHRQLEQVTDAFYHNNPHGNTKLIRFRDINVVIYRRPGFRVAIEVEYPLV